MCSVNRETEAARPTDRKAIGDWGEKAARGYLEKHGYKILEQNYRCARGEIDLIAIDGDCLVFIEVKTRSSDLFGPPQEAVDARKKKKLIELAEIYIDRHPNTLPDWRIDVLAISLQQDGRVGSFELIQDAVEG